MRSEWLIAGFRRFAKAELELGRCGLFCDAIDHDLVWMGGLKRWLIFVGWASRGQHRVGLRPQQPARYRTSRGNPSNVLFLAEGQSVPGANAPRQSAAGRSDAAAGS